MNAAPHANRYRQRQHGQGINSWVYSYSGHEPLTKSWVGCGLEIGVQLSGTWNQTNHFSGAHPYGPAQIVRVSAGEVYASHHRGAAEPVLQVGFVLCDPWDEPGVDGELRFIGDSGRADPLLLELSTLLAHSDDVDDEMVARLVRGYIARHCEFGPRTPLLTAKRELERFFRCDLPMEHVAAVGGLHPETFARQFNRTYGVTPASYRIRLRANHASRLLWSRPDLSIAEIADDSGFANLSYFHRTFRHAFGMTANAARARFLRD